MPFLGERGFSKVGDGDVATPVPGGYLIVSRAHCRYEFLPRHPRLNAAQADRAALLVFETRAPFLDAQGVVLRAPRGFGLWWWDKNAAAGDGGAGTTARVLPEAALFVVEDGWRQVQTREGVEARYCEDLTLIASQWRRRPFTADQWQAFVNSVDHPKLPAPANPPSVEAAQIAPRAASKLPIVAPPQFWTRMDRLAWISTAICGAACLVFAAQALNYTRAASFDRAAIEKIRAEESADPKRAVNEAELALIKDQSDLGDRPSPVLVVAETYKALAQFGIQPRRWQANPEEVRMEIVQTDAVRIEDIASLLERNAILKNVVAQKDPVSGAQMIVAKICGPLRAPECRSEAADVDETPTP